MNYRKQALDAYPHVCDVCGAPHADSAPLEVHHRDLDHFNHIIPNLQIMCRPCHRRLHPKSSRQPRRIPSTHGDRIIAVSVGLRPIEHVAARILAKRRRVSVSEHVRAQLRDEMTARFGTDWEDHIVELAARHGIAA